MNNTEYSPWSNKIYPCSECDFIGALDAFTIGTCYDACPACGGKRKQKTGRFIYEYVPRKYFPFLKRKVFKAVEWRKEKDE